MIDKKINLALIIATLALLLGGVIGVAILNGGQEGPQVLSGMTNYDSLTLGEDLVVIGTSSFTGLVSPATLTVSGTTTIAQSRDGFTIGGTITLTATDTPQTIYTHDGSPMVCDSDTAFLRIQSNGSFSPAFGYSLSKNIAGAADLIATSTSASTTSSVVEYTETLFHMVRGDTVKFLSNDDDHTSASSTYWGNISMETQMWCSQLEI